MPPSPALALLLVVVTAALLWVPGALVGRALGLRRRWALAGAPALTFGLVTAAGAAVPWAGLAWGPWTALAALAVAVAVAGATRPLGRLVGPLVGRRVGPLVGRRRGGAVEPPAPSASSASSASSAPSASSSAAAPRRSLLAAAAGCAAAAGLVTAVAWRADHRLGALAQTWDAVYHSNLTAFMAATGDSDPVSAPSALASAGWRTVETYYPATMHALAALVVRLTGADAAAVLDVLLVLVSAAVLPVAAAALAGAAAPARRGTAAAAAAVASVLPVAYPVDQWWRGVWSYGVALTVAVLVAALALRALQGRLAPGRPGAAAAAVVLAAAGVAGLQPAGAVLAGVLVLAWALARLVGAARHHRSPRLRAGAAAAVVGALLLPPLVLQLARWSQALGSLAAFDYTTQPGTARGRWDALVSVLGMLRQVYPGYGYPVPPQQGQWLLTAVVLGSVLLVVTARATRWLALLWGVLVVAAVSTIAPVAGALTPAGADLLRSLTLFFYNAPYRLMSVVAVVSAVVVGLAAARAVALLAAAPRGRRRWLEPAAAVAATALLAAVAVESSDRASVRLAAGYQPRVTGPDQLAVLDRLAQVLREQPLPDGATVANDPLDGSPWAYALHGTPVLFRHYAAGEVPAPARVLLDSLHDVDRDPAVRDALRELRVCYVYASDTRVQDSTPLSPGFADLDGAAALQPVARSGGAAAYRVLVPGTPCAPT